MVNKNVTIEILDSCNKGVEPIYSMFFGHSLDKTDGDIIKKAIDKSDKVFVMCSSPGHKSSMIRNLIDIYGEQDFRRFCLVKNKSIYFIDQKEMSQEFGFTKTLLSEYNSLFNKNYNYNIFVGFMNNYFNTAYIGISRLEELCCLLFRFFQEKLINKEHLDIWLGSIKDKIKYLYNEETIIFKSESDLFKELDITYEALVK